MLSTQQQLLVIGESVSLLANRLSQLVSLFGGKKMAQDLRAGFLTEAGRQSIKTANDSYLISATPENWAAYAGLLAELIQLASKRVGHNAVEKEVVAVMDQLEKKYGPTAFEVFFKLDIHKYRKGLVDHA